MRTVGWSNSAKGVLLCFAAFSLNGLNHGSDCYAESPASSSAATATTMPAFTPRMQLHHAGNRDQDDLCFWRNRLNPEHSLIITSDKKANLVTVYDLKGAVKQTIDVPKPGNIDIRCGVRLGDQSRDLVVVNQRSDGTRLLVFEVDSGKRRLARLDRGDISTGPNYGGCLYLSCRSGLVYFVATSEEGTVEQHELRMDAAGRLSGERVRQWKIGKCEGAVADDERGRLYISEEATGVWELGAEPDAPTPGTLVIRVNEHGLKPDLEGITLLKPKRKDGVGYDGCLILSSQGQSRYFVYERESTHRFLGDFSIAGAEETDGIDVIAEPFGAEFPHGVFGCHSNRGKKPILLTSWEEISRALELPAR